VVGAVQLDSESAELVFHRLGRAAAAFRRVLGASAGPGGRRHGRDPAVAAGPGGVVRRGGRGRGRRDADRAAWHLLPAVVVTVAGSAGALPGAAAGSVKVTPMHEYRPRAGPPAGCAATGSSGARTRWWRPGPGRPRRWVPASREPRSPCPTRSGGGTGPGSGCPGRWRSSAARCGCRDRSGRPWCTVGV